MTTAAKTRVAVTTNDHALAKRCAIGRVVVIDYDNGVLEALQELLSLAGYACETYTCALAYLKVLEDNPAVFPGPCCVVCEVMMPDINGLEMQTRLTLHSDTPLLLMSGASGAPEVAIAFRAGAVDFLIKPMDADVLLKAIDKALQLSNQRQSQKLRKATRALQLATLTKREREVVSLVAQGRTNIAIANEIGIALRTTKLHRQRGLEKLGVNNLVELVRLADEVDL